MSASGRLGCIIWAEFVLTRVGCSEATENIWFTTNDQFYSRKNWFQTWPSDAALTLALPNKASNFVSSQVNAQSQPEVSRYNCISEMFANSIFGNWTVHDGDARSFMGSNRVQLIFEDNKGAL